MLLWRYQVHTSLVVRGEGLLCTSSAQWSQTAAYGFRKKTRLKWHAWKKVNVTSVIKVKWYMSWQVLKSLFNFQEQTFLRYTVICFLRSCVLSWHLVLSDKPVFSWLEIQFMGLVHLFIHNYFLVIYSRLIPNISRHVLRVLSYFLPLCVFQFFPGREHLPLPFLLHMGVREILLTVE